MSAYKLAKKLKITLSSSALSMLVCVSAVKAEDIEIFTANTANAGKSNVVFIIDTSGSMGQVMPNDDQERTKIQVVKDVFEQLIFDPDLLPSHDKVNPKTQGLRFALMRFDDGANHNGNPMGGFFITPMQTLNNNTARTVWDDGDGNGIKWLEAGGYTPLSETLYEAARFFRGDTPSVYDGNSSSPGTNHAGVLLGNNNNNNNIIYKSPFRSAPNNFNAQTDTYCDTHHVVLLTDGLPTKDSDADTAINALPYTTETCAFSEANNGSCLPQVAQYLYQEDFLGNIEGFSNVPNEPDRQSVRTHTIAFDLSGNSDAVELLRKTAEDYGGGVAVNANSPSELAQAFMDVLTDIDRSTRSMISPAVSVSTGNRFVHNNEVYFGLFKPDTSPKWDGNLKGYRVNSSGILVDFTGGESVPADSDANNNVYTIEGEISSVAKSKWSSQIDGANVSEGGAAEQIQAQTNRRVYTSPTNVNSKDLTAFTTANASSLPYEDFGIAVPDISDDAAILAANSERNAIIDWAVSRDENRIGDPLHSNPQMVNYGGSTNGVIFFATNQGFLHAVSAETGEELMSFIPKSLLSNLKLLQDNVAGESHPYGLDGPITVYRKDGDNDGVITAGDADDQVIVIVGMRRGGNDYFAIDATSFTQPKLLWHIKGGATNTNYVNMGQSWSTPVVTTMNTGDSNDPTKEEVVLISGGYNTGFDDGLTADPDLPSGAGIYAVRLSDGTCVWHASASPGSLCESRTSVSGMSRSIPSTVSAIDLNSDGVVDRLYTVDILGKIFRIDFNTTNDSGLLDPTGKTFANLESGSRKFYYPVDVAKTSSGAYSKLHISVGSGFRAHPLANSSDIFASIWDTHMSTSETDGSPTISLSGENSLEDLTTIPDPENFPTITSGWYFNLSATEKVLAPATSFAGYLFFTTYQPPSPDMAPSCKPALGAGHVYAVKLDDSTPLTNTRSVPVATTGIPSAVALMVLEQTTTSEGGFASQDSEVFAMVGGTRVKWGDAEQDQKAQEELNKGLISTKSYWYIGEPQ